MFEESLTRFDCKQIVYSPPDDNKKSFGNLVGLDIYDKTGACIGVATDVYCCPETLKSEYLEITPYDSKDRSVYVFPFDRVQFGSHGKTLIPITEWQLKRFKEYNCDYVLNVLRRDLITYEQAISEGYRYNTHLNSLIA